MWNQGKNSAFLNRFTAKLLITGMFILPAGVAQALTADDVLNKMNSKEQTAYISGLIGGFAYSRFLREKPEKAGMNCIYDWFHGDNKTAWKQIDTWFSHHLDKPVEPLLYVLVKKKCGE